jgi:6-phosphogluconolactonase (cycloisomerase 2 family)
MNMAFHDDGDTVVIANHNDGSLAVCSLQRGEVLHTVQAGVGVETLSFF